MVHSVSCLFCDFPLTLVKLTSLGGGPNLSELGSGDPILLP